MPTANIPEAGDRRALREAVRAAGHRYIDALGWAVFLEKRGTDRIYSLKMCDECANTYHDRATCPHPACHGLYAATTDHDAFERLWEQRPEGDVLAVRTGAASGIFVVDFDLKHEAPQAHDRWAEATGCDWYFDRTLRQTTKSGGFHLVYRYPRDGEGIRSRNSVTLRGVDIKGDGGLFRVDPTPGYSWLERVLPSVASDEVVDWARNAPVHRSAESRRARSRLVSRIRSGSGGTSTSGISMKEASLAGCPVGDRDWYVNAVAFMLRKEDVPWTEAVEIMRDEFDRLEKPEGDEWRWEWCMYKLTRAWRDVVPDRTVATGTRWARSANRPTTSLPLGAGVRRGDGGSR